MDPLRLLVVAESFCLYEAELDLRQHRKASEPLLNIASQRPRILSPNSPVWCPRLVLRQAWSSLPKLGYKWTVLLHVPISCTPSLHEKQRCQIKGRSRERGRGMSQTQGLSPTLLHPRVTWQGAPEQHHKLFWRLAGR